MSKKPFGCWTILRGHIHLYDYEQSIFRPYVYVVRKVYVIVTTQQTLRINSNSIKVADSRRNAILRLKYKQLFL